MSTPITVITTHQDGLQVHLIVLQEVTIATKQLLAMQTKLAEQHGWEQLTKEELRATWLSKSKITCTNFRDLTGECAWNRYVIVEHFTI
jgi:hypothetical protein